MPQIEKKEYQNPSIGSHGAYLIGIYDLGTQPGSVQFPTPKRVVKLHFELPLEKGEFDGVEKPLAVRANYTLSTGERARFRPVFEALFKGKPEDNDYYTIDFDKLIGSACTVTLVQNGEYINVAQVAPLTKGIKLPEVYNELKVFDLDKFKQSDLALVPVKLQEKIKASPEYKKIMEEEEKNADLPFN